MNGADVISNLNSTRTYLAVSIALWAGTLVSSSPTKKIISE